MKGPNIKLSATRRRFYDDEEDLCIPDTQVEMEYDGGECNLNSHVEVFKRFLLAYGFTSEVVNKVGVMGTDHSGQQFLLMQLEELFDFYVEGGCLDSCTEEFNKRAAAIDEAIKTIRENL